MSKLKKLANKALWNYLWELAFPDVCSYCNRNLKKGDFPLGICPFCYSDLKLRAKHKSKTVLQNPENALAKERFELYILAYYEGDVRHAIRALKFHDRTDYAKSLGSIMAVFLNEIHQGNTIYCIAMPIHEKRLRERYYNQVELVLEEMAKHITLIDLSFAFRRVKITKRQSECESRAERMHNLKNAFEVVDPEALEGKIIYLLDDVVSSGASMWEAAKALKPFCNELKLLCIASEMPINRGGYDERSSD